MPSPSEVVSALADRVVHPAQVGPERHRLQRLHEHADVEQRVAQVGAVEAAVGPAGLLAEGRAPETGEQGGAGGALRVDRLLGALVAGHHQAATGRLRLLLATDLGGIGEVDRRLGLVGETQHGREHTRLRERAHRGGAAVEGVPAPGLVDLHDGHRADAHRDGGDHAEGALGAHHHLAKVGAGSVGRGVAQHELALRGRDPEADHQRVEPAVARGRLARGAGDREAADRGVLEGLREVTERQAVLGQQRLGLRPAEAGLEGGGHRAGVHGEQPVEAEQVEGHHAGEVARDGRPGRRRPRCRRRTGPAQRGGSRTTRSARPPPRAFLGVRRRRASRSRRRHGA